RCVRSAVEREREEVARIELHHVRAPGGAQARAHGGTGAIADRGADAFAGAASCRVDGAGNDLTAPRHRDDSGEGDGTTTPSHGKTPARVGFPSPEPTWTEVGTPVYAPFRAGRQ